MGKSKYVILLESAYQHYVDYIPTNTTHTPPMAPHLNIGGQFRVSGFIPNMGAWLFRMLTYRSGPLPEATPTESDCRIMPDLVWFGR